MFWFRPRQTWRRRGRSALKLGCILRVKTTILPLATVVKFQFPQRGELPPICRNIWPHSMAFAGITCLHYEVAASESPATGGVHRRQPGGGGVHRRQPGGGASPATGGVHRRQPGGGGASPATGGVHRRQPGGPPRAVC